MVTHAPWLRSAGLAHAFLGAAQCGAGRDWTGVLEALDLAIPLFAPQQVHGATVVLAAPPADSPPDADGAVVDHRGLLVGVVTADCAPVLLLDAERRVAAAVHAGWRGAAAGVIESGVARLLSRGARTSGLTAAIGPAVGGCCYEVGEEVREAFVETSTDCTADAWSRQGNSLRLDLRLAIRRLLETAGISRVDVVGPCTVCGDGYHSYRRDGARAGRQLSFIGWR